jgi:hypothetical protein
MTISSTAEGSMSRTNTPSSASAPARASLPSATAMARRPAIRMARPAAPMTMRNSVELIT